MNKPKAIGTKAETAVARFLVANGFPHAERRALRGTLDAGDITGTPGVVWEVKGGEAARNASDALIEQWLTEAETERVNAGADIAVLILQRRGVGPANAGRWWAIARLGDIIALHDPSTPREMRCTWPVRMLLADAVHILRAHGYGQPIDEAVAS